MSDAAPAGTLKRFTPLISVSLVLFFVVIYFFFFRRTSQAQFITEPVTRGTVRNAVNATGTVQAVLTVQVGSQVSGQVEALYADYNSVVKRGQLLAKLDPRNYQAQLAAAQANLAAAQARVHTAEADLNSQTANRASAIANVAAAEAARDNAKRVFERYQQLAQQGILSQNDFDTAKSNADSTEAKLQQAKAQLDQVEAQINSSKAQLEQAKAQVDQAEAALKQAQVNLDYTSITSPVDGVVVSRSVDVGQTVAASLQAPTLFVIANDLTKMQVNASVDEADIGNVTDAEQVEFTVDAYPNRTFRGRITEIRLQPETVQNVVTYSVIIQVDNDRLELKPGMTANITITVAQQPNVLRVPNAALRYLPPGVTRDQVAEMVRKQQGAATGDAAANASAGPGRQGLDRGARAQGVGTAPEAGGNQSQGSVVADNSGAGASAFSGSAAGGWQGGQGMRGRRGMSGDNSGGWQGASGERGAVRGNGASGQANAETSQNARASTAMPQGLPRSGATPDLAPGQLWNPSEKIQFPRRQQRALRPSVVWVLASNGKPEPRNVVLGITDGTYTQVVSGDLKESDKIVVGDSTQAAPPQSQQNRGGFGGPVFFGRGGR